MTGPEHVYQYSGLDKDYAGPDRARKIPVEEYRKKYESGVQQPGWINNTLVGYGASVP